MPACPVCKEEIEIDESDLEEGDGVSCDDCGAALLVSQVDPLVLSEDDDDDDDLLDDEDEEDDDEGEEDDEDEDEDEDPDEE